jgi:hypothetical protein
MKLLEGFRGIARLQAPICLVLIFTAIVLINQNVWAQPCNRKGIVKKDTQLYNKPPAVITGKGLVYGNTLGTLSDGIAIYICQEVTIGFGFSTQQWYHIAYWKDAWSFAWVFANDIRLASSQGLPGIEQKFALIPLAWAATSSETLLTAQNSPTSPPPGQEPPSLPRPGDSHPEISSGPLYELYIWLFLAMVIGMIAKALHDMINSVTVATFKEHLRSIVTPILVSPIVFLGLMSSAEVSVDQKRFIILLFLAFQNGFFWKTVLDKNKI